MAVRPGAWQTAAQGEALNLTMPITIAIPVGPNPSNVEWLGECLASIAEQTVTPDEILIIDDGANLDPAEYPAVRIWPTPWQSGVAHAFNYGVALAKNDLVLMLGSDDRLMPHAIQACQWAWDHWHDPLGYYYFIIEYESGRFQDIPCNGAFVHKELWKRTGGFPVEAAMGACDTWLISLLYASKGRAGNLYQISPAPLYWYRDHPQTDTVQRGAWMGMIVTARNIWVEKKLTEAAKEQYEYWLTHWSDVQAHLPTLYEYARGNVLELGVRAGVSTSALLAGVTDHGGHVWSVDRDDCSPVFGNHPHWTFVQADSCEEIEGLPDELDCLFIDTEHTAERTLRELCTWGPIVKKGGVILLHDTDDGSTYPGVRTAMEDYCERTKRTPEYHEGSYGLGVIRV